MSSENPRGLAFRRNKVPFSSSKYVISDSNLPSKIGHCLSDNGHEMDFHCYGDKTLELNYFSISLIEACELDLP